MPKPSLNGCLNDFRLANPLNGRPSAQSVDVLKETALRLLSPENGSRRARRRNRMVYNLREAGVPWWTICAIVRRCESAVRSYFRLGQIESDNCHNPFFFMSNRTRTWLTEAHINTYRPCEYARLLALGNKLHDYYPQIGKKSADEIRLAAVEQAGFQADRNTDRAFAKRLLIGARNGWRLEGLAA